MTPADQAPVSTASAGAPPNHRSPILQLSGVNKRFGAVQALTDVDLDVYRGEVVALVGDNGAGKSTLVKVIAGVHPPDTGQLTFDGRPVHVTSPAQARHLG